MTVLNFADFARRGPSAIPTAPQRTDYVAPPVTDRWATLHTATAPAMMAPTPAADYWSDLQLRMAYPTLHMRHGA